MNAEVIAAIVTGCVSLVGIVVSLYFKRRKDTLQKEIEKIHAEENKAVDMSEVVVKAQKAAQDTAEKAYQSQIGHLQSEMGDLKSAIASTEKEIENVRERAREDRKNSERHIKELREQAMKDRKRANMALRNADRRVYRLSSLLNSTQSNIKLLGSHIEHVAKSAKLDDDENDDLVDKLRTLSELQNRVVTSLEESSAAEIESELKDELDII